MGNCSPAPLDGVQENPPYIPIAEARGFTAVSISSYYDLEYICRLVKPLTEVPSNIRHMNDDDFLDLVKEADSGVPATWLPDTVIMGEETKNTLLNRVIIWQAIEVAKLEKKAAKKDA